MVMSWIFTGFLVISIIFSLFSGNSLGAAVTQGAQGGLTLAISIGGSLCLWSGVGHLMQKIGLTGLLAKWMRPVLHRLFPSSAKDPLLSSALSGNICANLLGLGNAATPAGIRAARRLHSPGSDTASDGLCRLVVLNTASVQLLPTTVAALRAACGCESPFDILPAVWLSSLCSVSAGLLAERWLRRWF